MSYKDRVWYKNRPAKCHYCDNPSTSWDHIVPWAMRGRSAFFNMVPACESCQKSKDNHFPTCQCEKCVNAIIEWTNGARRVIQGVRKRG